MGWRNGGRSRWREGTFSPVDLVDFIGAPFPQLEDPGPRVGLQLEVTLQRERESSHSHLLRVPSTASLSGLSRGQRSLVRRSEEGGGMSPTRLAMTMVSMMTGLEAVDRKSVV